MERTGLLPVESKQELWVSHNGSRSFRRAKAYETVYSPNGNIDYKTGVGEYMYDEKKQPNAIKSIENLEGYAPSFRQSIRYNVFNRVESVSEGADSLSFAYGVDQQRFKTFLYKNNVLVKEKHFAEDYEVEIAGGKKREIHYVAAPTGLVAVLIRSASADSLFYVCTDHLGSIIAIADATGKVLERRSFDAWGRERNPDNWDDYSVAIAGRLDRGYTGHEHLPQFGLINMNARLYDPVLGRFLSPDPFVQSPLFSQNFNRYSYVLNNPLKYTDPDGEKILSLGTVFSFFTDFVKTIFTGGLDPTSGSARDNAWRNFDPTAPWSKTNHALMIDDGLFNGSFKQVVSRFTREFPQEILGYHVAQIENLVGLVNKVSYFDGATVINTNYLANDNIQRDQYGNEISGGQCGSAFTLGSFINGPSEMLASPNDPTFVHEYGRYLQSQAEGPAYLFYTAIPNLVWGGNDDDTSYDANARALIYFNKHYGTMTYGTTLGNFSWDFTPTYGTPIPGYDPNKPFDDPSNQAALKNNMRTIRKIMKI